MKERWLWFFVLLLDAIVGVIFIRYTWPAMKGTSTHEAVTLYLFQNFVPMFRGKFSRGTFLMMTIVILAGTVLALLMYHKRYILQMCVVFLGFSMILFFNIERFREIESSAKRVNMSNAAVELLKERPELLKGAEIYYYGKGTYSKSMVFSFYDQTLYCMDVNKKFEGGEGKVYFTYIPEIYQEDGMNIFQLDENEYLVTEDEEIAAALEGIYQRWSASK